MNVSDADIEALFGGARAGVVQTEPFVGRWSVRDGEYAQLMILEKWRSAGEVQAGWKVGMTSGEARDALGAGVRPFGFLLQSRVYRSGEKLDHAPIGRMGLETELCFRVGKPLSGPDVQAKDARAATTAVAPAFEVNQDRLRGPRDPGIRIADNLHQWGIVLGRDVFPVPSDAVLEEMSSTLRADGAVLQEVRAHGHIDDHFASIAALARELHEFGLGLKSGDVVITGSFTKDNNLVAATYEGSFTSLGSVSVTVV